MTRSLARLLVVALLALGCAPTTTTSPSASQATVVSSPSSGGPSVPTPAASIPAAMVDPTPADPTPESVIDSFIATVRPGTMSFHLRISGSYTIGSHEIRYEFEGNRAGPDVLISGTQTTDGQAGSLGWGFVGDRLYAKVGTSWSSPTQDLAAAGQFASALYRLDNALVLGDLGKESGDGPAHYRLRVTTAMTLYPPQFLDGTISNPHDATDRIELVVDETGTPERASYTRSVRGTIDGKESVAQGAIEFAFSDVGKPITIDPPELSPGASLPPLIPYPTPGAEPTWQTYRPVAAGFSAQFPGEASVTTTSQQTERLGQLVIRIARLNPSTGPRLSVIDTVLPDAYLAAHPADELLDIAGRGTADSVGAQIFGRRVVTTGGIRGLEFLAASQTAIYRYREFLVGDRSIEFGVIGDPTGVATEAVDRFLGSLAVVP